ncbi:helix-turn-helix domain-containing protein [Tenacibaculum sp. SG-28]|uniref:helix-turn-helix domain-containing protein n=1 Tax=Tenacibaculum sp. SG-28 TaxID=754426 RepID=UPI000CF3C2E0|nr:helix-turn-helix transcriptional regulator [Tenacibaculum sp. SG-28]PQJ23480.1 transcriptional regulator [Tenacibaculum sp. SG-28]
MDTGKIIESLRKKLNWSQSELSDKTNVSLVMTGKYERGEAMPSIEADKSIANAFNVSLDYLREEGVNASFDKKTVQRLKDIQSLDSDKQKMLFKLIDTVIRDTKAKSAYNS